MQESKYCILLSISAGSCEVKIAGQLFMTGSIHHSLVVLIISANVEALARDFKYGALQLDLLHYFSLLRLHKTKVNIKSLNT